jgi:hypothetical protein
MFEYVIIEIAKRRQLQHFLASGFDPERTQRLRRSAATRSRSRRITRDRSSPRGLDDPPAA